MNGIAIVAAKEIQEGLRNRWVIAATALLAALALTLTFVGSAPTGNVGAAALDVVIVSLSSLTIFLVPLIALLISHDAIVGEIERGTMLLLLSYPVARWQVLIGKFVGHLAILGFATFVGYGTAAASLAATGAVINSSSWIAFASMTVTSVLLGASFVAIGYLLSALARDRGTAGGLAIGIWLLFVLIYDMALLGFLVVDQGAMMTAGILDVLLLLNPTDAYRLLNFVGSEEVSSASGMSGIARNVTLTSAALAAALAAWTLVPLVLAASVFSRREF